MYLFLPFFARFLVILFRCYPAAALFQEQGHHVVSAEIST